MWLLTGPFDEDNQKNITKVLQTDHCTTLGRKAPSELIVNNKKVSKEHCDFTVASWDCTHVAEIPTITLLNHRDGKNLRILRRDVDLIVNGLTTRELEDEDHVFITNTEPAQLEWRSISCYSEIRPEPSLMAECTRWGIGLMHSQHKLVTHHLTSELSLTPGIVASLLSACTLVTPSWLADTLSSAALPGAASFALIPAAKYEPSFATSLPKEYRHRSKWLPNEERVSLFQDFRFLFATETGRVDSCWVNLVTRGGGSYEGFSMQNGTEGFQKIATKALRKASDKQHIVAVAEPPKAAGVMGDDNWNALLDEMTHLGVNFASEANVLASVVQIDISCLSKPPSDSDYRRSSLPHGKPAELPSPQQQGDHDIGVASKPPRTEDQTKLNNVDLACAEITRDASNKPSTDPLGKTQPAVPKRRLVRRVGTTPQPPVGDLDPFSMNVQDNTSRAPSAADTAGANEPLNHQDAERPKPRKPLVRRAGQNTNAESGLVPEVFFSDTPGTQIGSAAPPSLPRRTPLKRRLGGNGPKETDELPVLPDLSERETRKAGGGRGEPPVKKFKALFEASDPRAAGGQSGDIASDSEAAEMQGVAGPTQTGPTQTQTQSGAKSSLAAVREEEEEASGATEFPASQILMDDGMGSQRSLRGTKRKASEGKQNASEAEGSRQSKRRAIGPSSVDFGIQESQTFASSQFSTNRPPSTQGQAPHSTQSVKAGGSGAEPGHPDTDPHFLEALATKRRGKKGEDQFDREFNQLKISKPDLEQQPQQQQRDIEEEWNVMDKLLDDMDLDIRGNFMTIVEMDVVRKPVSRPVISTDPKWEGKPNFKKFRKQGTAGNSSGGPKPKKKFVELVLVGEPEGDLGTGPAYWKTSRKQSSKDEASNSSQNNPDITNGEFDEQIVPVPSLQDIPSSNESSQADLAAPPPKTARQQKKPPSSRLSRKPPSSIKKGKARAVVINDSDDEDDSIMDVGDLLPSKRGSAKARASSAAPLFIISDEEESNSQMTQRSTRSTRTSAKSGRAAEDMEEDEDVIAPTRASRPSRKKVAPAKKAIIVDDDDSDDGGFKGFGSRRRR